MGSKSKQDQSAGRHVNDYERNRLLRVQENQERLRELGVKKIAKSLTSLVESQKEKDKMWEFVLEKYIVPDAAKDWVLRSIGASWRGYKCRIKKKHFYKFKDNKTRWKNRPNSIPTKDFLSLLSSWNKKDVMDQCLLKRNARKAQKNMHTAGPKSFARIRAELMDANPNKEPLSLTQMFERTRRRTNGNVYQDTYDDTEKKIEQMKNYQPSENGNAVVNPFLAVMSKEYDGHCRLYGKGVTKKHLKNVNDGDTSYMVPGTLMEPFKASLEAEKKQLVDMRKELEEEHERKKAELEEEHERKKAELEDIRKDIQNQQDTLVEAALQKLMKKLPAGVFETL